MTYEEIKNQILEIQIDFPQTGATLMQALEWLSNASYDEETASDVVFSEYDGLDCGEIEEGTELWIEIRDLQHNIVRYASETA